MKVPLKHRFFFYHIWKLKYGNNFEKHYHIADYHIFGYLKKLPYSRLPYLRKLSEISPYPITIFAIWYKYVPTSYIYFSIFGICRIIVEIFCKLLKYGNKKNEGRGEEGEGQKNMFGSKACLGIIITWHVMASSTHLNSIIFSVSHVGSFNNI